MNIKEEFFVWLSKKPKKNGQLLKEKSVKKYVDAIDTISEDMINTCVIDRSLFNINSVDDLERLIVNIKNNSDFNFKNDIGHNMYSVALDHYEDFFNNR